MSSTLYAKEPHVTPTVYQIQRYLALKFQTFGSKQSFKAHQKSYLSLGKKDKIGDLFVCCRVQSVRE